MTEQDGQFLEADGSSCEKAEHRYVLSLKMADSRGEMNLNLFNKEVSGGGGHGPAAGDTLGGSGEVFGRFGRDVWSRDDRERPRTRRRSPGVAQTVHAAVVPKMSVMPIFTI